MGTNSYVCRSYRGNTGRGLFWSPPLPSWIGLTTKAELKEEQDKIIKLQAFDPSYVRGKSYYEDDELFSISAAVWIF